jgi:hypothetical protein
LNRQYQSSLRMGKIKSAGIIVSLAVIVTQGIIIALK